MGSNLRSVVLLCACVFFLFACFEAWGLELLGETYPDSGASAAVVVKASPSGHVDLETSMASFLRPGDRVDLVHQAGLLPMHLGVYEVAAVSQGRVSLRPVTVMSPPSRDMRVEVHLRQEPGLPPVAPAPARTHEDRVEGHGDQPDMSGLIFRDEGVTGVLLGTVSDVRGQDIVVEVGPGDGARLAPGQAVEAFLVLGSGQELSAGTWTVSSVDGDRAVCSPQGEVHPRKGLKAVVTLSGSPSSLPPEYESGARFLENFDRSGNMFGTKEGGAK